MQENYVGNATTTWLESIERSLAQMKEYQVSAQNHSPEAHGIDKPSNRSLARSSIPADLHLIRLKPKSTSRKRRISAWKRS